LQASPEPAAECIRFTRPELDGVELHALRWGDRGAPPLILLHGAGANVHWWRHLAPSLAARFHVIALDFRGHGDSDQPEERPPGAVERDVQALLEEIGAESPVLIGHSLGAHVALAFAAKNEHVRAVVLVDPSRGVSASRRRATRLALSLNPSYATRDHAVRRFRFLPGADQASEALRRAIAEESVYQQPDGRWGYKFDERWFALPPTERPDGSRVACPVLIVRGADSPLLTAEGAAALAADLPRGRLIEIADAGHHVIVDQPERWLAAVESFLAEVAPA